MKHTITQEGKEKTVNLTPIKAIRLRCLDCSGFSSKEVNLCPVTGCPLYPYRLGKNPAIKRRGSKGNVEALKKWHEFKKDKELELEEKIISHRAI